MKKYSKIAVLAALVITAMCAFTACQNSDGLSLNLTEVQLEIGESVDLVPSLNGLSGAVSYQSSNIEVAVVNSSGKVTALSEGTANITASLSSYSAVCVVRVVPIDYLKRAKTQAKDALADYLASLSESSYFPEDWQAVCAIISDAIDAIELAESVDDVNDIRDAALSDAALIDSSENLAQNIESAINELDNYIAGLESAYGSNYSQLQSIVADAKLVIEDADTNADVAQALSDAYVEMDKIAANAQKLLAVGLLDSILDGKTAINVSGTAKYFAVEFYSSENILIAQSRYSYVVDIINAAVLKTEIDTAVGRFRSTDSGESLSIYSLPRLSVDEYIAKAKDMLLEFKNTHDFTVHYSDIAAQMIEYIDEQILAINDLSGKDKTIDNVKQIKDDCIEIISTWPSMEDEFLNWEIDYISNTYITTKYVIDRIDALGVVAPRTIMSLVARIAIQKLYADQIEQYDMIMDKYASHVTKLVNAVKSFSAVDLKEYSVSAIYFEFGYSLYLNMWPYPGASTTDIVALYKALDVYDINAEAEFKSILLAADFAPAISAAALGKDEFLAEYLDIMEQTRQAFWDINWKTDRIYDITVDLKGGTIVDGMLDGETGDENGKLYFKLRFRDLYSGDLSYDEDGNLLTYYVTDIDFSDYKILYNMLSVSAAQKGDSDFEGWRTSDNSVIRYDDDYFRHIDDGLYSTTIIALFAEKASDSPIVGVWTWNNTMTDVKAEIYADGTLDYYMSLDVDPVGGYLTDNGDGTFEMFYLWGTWAMPMGTLTPIDENTMSLTNNNTYTLTRMA